MKLDNLILIVALAVTVIVLVFIKTDYHGVRVYDCSMSEISPDYPVEVKQECRRLRLEEYQKNKGLVEV
jgi:hypothetical protein